MIRKIKDQSTKTKFGAQPSSQFVESSDLRLKKIKDFFKIPRTNFQINKLPS